mmetsp:Transcript_31696/g.62872  ORF Transcript_31696/g.62872 Transcript_31696/m.62872 type:complete len:260 (-) Transcript_31696:1319-2098(-)
MLQLLNALHCPSSPLHQRTPRAPRLRRRGLGVASLQKLLHLHLLHLEFVNALLDDALCVDRKVKLPEVGRELETVDAAAVVSDNDHEVTLVEADVRELGALHDLLLAERLVLVLGEVEHVHLSVGGDGGEDGGAVGRPAHVADGVAEVERHDGVAEGVIPDLHGPVGGAGDEDTLVEGVPLDAVHGHVVSLVGSLVLAGVGLGAGVDVSLLGSDDEKVLLRLSLVKVEAAAAGEAGQRRLLRIVLDIVHKLEEHDGLHL